MNELDIASPTIESEYAPVDLCERKANGLTVILYWLKATNTVHICLMDEKKGDTEFFSVPNDKAMDAFNHPFAYRPPGML